MKRRNSIPIRVGNVVVGGGNPIIVQSMTKTDTRDVKATVEQIHRLEEAGCQIVRSAVPDMEAAQALAEIKQQIKIPLIADIHFNYLLALESLKSGVDGLRLNPGNIGDPKKIKAVAFAAKEREVPIRIGVNSGSIPKDLDPKIPLTERMVEAAIREIYLLEEVDFNLIKVSLKASDILTTVEAHKLIADKIPYPFHIGITEAGPPKTGTVRSAVGIGILLYLGIGDTVRVSLTTKDPTLEVEVAYEILKNLGLSQRGPTLVSCPTCGRTEVDLVSLAEKLEERLKKVKKPLKVAAMGCRVNGIGEAKDADVGLACGKGRGVIFRKGEIVRTVAEKDFLTELMAEVEKV